MQCPPMPTQAYGDVFAMGLPPIATRLRRRFRRSMGPGWCRPPQFSAPGGAVGGAAGCAYVQPAAPAGCAYALPTKMPSAATTTTQRATRLAPSVLRVRAVLDPSCCIRCSFTSGGLIEPNGADGALQVRSGSLHVRSTLARSAAECDPPHRHGTRVPDSGSARSHARWEYRQASAESLLRSCNGHVTRIAAARDRYEAVTSQRPPCDNARLPGSRAPRPYLGWAPGSTTRDAVATVADA